MTLLRMLSFIVLAAVSLGASAHGQTPKLRLDPAALSGMRIGAYVEYVEDPRPHDQFAAIRRDWAQLNPIRQPQSAFSVGMLDKVHWFKLTITQAQPQPRMIYLEHDYPSHILDVFHVAPQEEFKLYRLGYGIQDSASIPYRNQTIALELQPGDHEIYFRLEHAGSMRFSVRLWSPEAFGLAKVKEEIIVGMVLGVSVLMVFYNIFTSLMLRSRVYLHYVGYLFSATVFLIFYSGVGQQLGPTIKWLSANFWMTSVCVMLFFTCRFTRIFLSLQERMPRMDILCIWLSYYFLFVAIMERINPTLAFVLTQMLSGPSAFLFLTIASFSALKGHRPARFYLISFVALLFGGVSESLVSLQILGPEFSFWPFFVAYCLQMVLLSLAVGDQIHFDQMKAQKEIEVLNKDLQHNIQHISEIVEDKTNEIRSLLDHIPQGVFVIKDQLLLSKQYSAHLPLLLGTHDIQDKSFVDLILDHTTLSSDQKDRIIQSLHATLGEDQLAFETNGNHLPAELTFIDKQGHEKTFETTWNVEFGAKQIVRGILVTVRDVTESRAMAKEIEKQQVELRYIKELIDCGATKFAQLVGTTMPLLEENENFIKRGVTDTDTIKIMFINAHTVKGAARTLGLTLLSNAIHEAEHHYSDIMKGLVPIDSALMESEMKGITRTLARYMTINRDTLGRQEDLTKVQVDKQFLAEHCSLMVELERSRILSGHGALDQEVKHSLNQMIKIIYKGLPYIVEDCFMHASRIAKDLGKPAPEITMHVPDMPVSQAIENVLRKVSIHLIRNAMDHGIESEQERLEAGKSPAGTLHVGAHFMDSRLQIVFKDDGRGLAVGLLREKGLKAGLLHENANPEEVAQTIFKSEISTSRTVSHISGRGMGMDAVRRYVEEIGGRIDIVLKNKKPSEGDYYDFEFQISFPLVEGLALAS